MADVVWAKASCVTEFEGRSVHVNANEVWDADDPFVRENPDMFSAHGPVRSTGLRTKPVETAMQRPGETRRGPGRPRKDAQ